MLTIEDLKAFGVNVDEGLGRCMNNEAFYLKLVKMALEDDACFDRLAQAVSDGDKQAAFGAAHDLKGVLGNLSLTPLFSLVSQMTEQLRGEEDADYPTQLATILEQRDRLKALCQ
ncbi:MAG: Hpt domain-containing protein [Synergistaceae bacterium]|nr:Hpt domain-containing protein [Synergistaceae bacterium]